MMSTQTGDADEPGQQMTDGVTQQRTAELSGVGICRPIPEQTASASATMSRVACRGRNSMQKTQVEQKNSSVTASA